MSTSKNQTIKSLQQYDWSKESINQIIHYVKTKELPKGLDSRQRRRFKEKFSKNWDVHKSKLKYTPLDLEVIPSDDTKAKQAVLNRVFKSPQSIGKGQNNFHSLVLQKYLGIKKDDVIQFLKTKPEYQLFQSAPRNVNRALRANKPLQILAIDLVDVENLYNKRENKPYKYILSAVDLHTGFTWYFPMKNKEASSTEEAFKKILEYNWKFHSPQVRRKMKREGKYDQIGTVLSDNGLEFKGEFSQFLKDNNIKQKFRSTYSPQPQVEAVNGVLRNIMRSHFIRTGKLIWKPYIDDFMKAKNSNRDENTGQPADKLMQEYFNNNQEELEKARLKLKVKRSKIDEKIKRFQKQALIIGDKVRVRLANFQSAVRKELKAKNSKQIVVRFSPEIYTIEKVIPVKPDKVGFPLYILKNSQNQIILNESGKKRIFGGNDLLKVPDDTLPTLIDLTRANALNRIPSPQQGETGRDLYIEPVVDDPEPEPVERKQSRRIEEPKPISQWKSKEWKEELKNKEFTDEGIKWIIVDVLYDRAEKVYMAIYIPKGEKNVAKNRERTPLKEIFQLAEATEDWVKPEYLNAV